MRFKFETQLNLLNVVIFHSLLKIPSQREYVISLSLQWIWIWGLQSSGSKVPQKSTEFTPNVSLPFIEENTEGEPSYSPVSLTAWPPSVEYQVPEFYFINKMKTNQQ